jgi:hypothetical protein
MDEMPRPRVIGKARESELEIKRAADEIQRMQIEDMIVEWQT